MLLCAAPDLHLVKSVGGAVFHFSGNVHHRASFDLLATHVLYTRLGLSRALLDDILEGPLDGAQNNKRSKSLITAWVHRDNAKCKLLLLQQSWVHSRMDVDGIHEEWDLAIAVRRVPSPIGL